MKHTKEQVVAGYDNPDPWGYKTNPCDQQRKTLILKNLNHFRPWAANEKGETFQRPFHNALDICCGEGWITGDIPATTIHGIELSEKAKERFPKNVIPQVKPQGQYELVMLTGALYHHYDWETFVLWIQRSASNLILLCNIKQWEVEEAVKQIPGEQILWFSFPYRDYEQQLRVFRI